MSKTNLSSDCRRCSCKQQLISSHDGKVAKQSWKLSQGNNETHISHGCLWCVFMCCVCSTVYAVQLLGLSWWIAPITKTHLNKDSLTNAIFWQTDGELCRYTCISEGQTNCSVLFNVTKNDTYTSTGSDNTLGCFFYYYFTIKTCVFTFYLKKIQIIIS